MLRETNFAVNPQGVSEGFPRGRTLRISGLFLFTTQDIIGHLAGVPVNGSKQRSRLRPFEKSTSGLVL